jgi:hypothetical protein
MIEGAERGLVADGDARVVEPDVEPAADGLRAVDAGSVIANPYFASLPFLRSLPFLSSLISLPSLPSFASLALRGGGWRG